MQSPYLDYIKWQANLLSGERGTQLKRYWESYLADAPIQINLPADYPRPIGSSYRGDVYLDMLTANQVEQIKQFGGANNIDLCIIFLANLYAFLGRLCKQEDLAIGLPMMSSWLDSKRSQSVIGMLANLVLCRIDLSEAACFSEMLNQVKSAFEEVEQHRDYPFIEVADYLSKRRGEITKMSSSVQVAFSWEKDLCDYIADSETFSIEPYPLGEQGGGAFDIYLTVMEVGNTLQLCWKYSTDLFKQATIARFAHQFKTLLMAAIAQPMQPLTQLNLLSDAERYQLLAAQKQRYCEPISQCIHELFEAQVERTPHEVAAIYEEEHLTYQELNQAANQLAHYLRDLGVQPDTLIGIFMPRSLEMIVGLLGVLKAGAAYVPIDPTYPPERLAYMLDDSQVSAVLVRSKSLDQLPETTAQVIHLASDWEIISQQSTANPSPTATPENLVYVIYTSGSTGKPKGVMIEHRSLVNFAQQACQEYDITAGDRILQFASFSFDAAVEEIYTCLISGGTLVLRPEIMLDSVPTFLRTCQAYALTVLDLPTAYWHLLVEVLANQPELSLPSTLRCLIIGGERANPYYVEQWQQFVGESPQLINTYGPTEATVVATAYRLPPDIQTEVDGSSPRKQPELPIGKPLGNIKVYVLDDQQQLVPFGLPGELCLGGAALARGYLNAPETTQKSFIPDEFSDQSGARLYRTGDLVRYLPDGNLEFLGRIDHQVKIRGFRVDLGEIESTITHYPGIRQVFVTAQPDRLGHQQLAAYIVSDLIPDRIPYQTDCLLEYADQLVKLKTVDISSFGVGLLKAPKALSQGDSVRIRFLLPGQEDEYWFDGTVIWHQGDRMGVQLQPTERDQTLLKQSAAYLLESQGILKALQRTVEGALRKYLKQKLPHYMIPTNFILINVLPLTPNGKVDRRQLPPPHLTQIGLIESDRSLPGTQTEQTLRKMWSTLLGVNQIELEDNFFDLGGNSLLAIQFINRLSEEFQVDIPVWMLFKHSTITSLAKVVDDLRQKHQSPDAQWVQSPTYNLQADAQLDPAIQYATKIDLAKVIAPSGILLTGPTGFVGPYLLSQLLQQTDADIYCLARYRSGQAARRRIEDQLTAYELWHPEYRQRIIPVIGDLAKPLLGLSESQFQDLANSIDVIYHNGAWVNFVYPYSALQAANVQGTQEVLRLAGCAKTKPVHLVSTLSVFSDAYAQKELVLETDQPRFEDQLQTGYDQSKWVAEQLVKAAQNRGLPATIYRLGTLLGDSETGITKKPNDFFCSLLKGCLQLGKAPILSRNLNITPVNYASQAIVHISQNPTCFGQAFHVINPQYISWKSLVACLQFSGYSVQMEPYEQWLSRLKQQVQAGCKNDLATFLPILGSEKDFPLETPEFDADLSQKALSKSVKKCPKINGILIKSYLDYFRKSGDLKFDSPQL
ncbi:MAG: amino acid adenylation domain-containing protein [Leptolyngbya sp. SIO1E4]|nr:amino acid adenylation domain-containing protein [Leptolyngbya sp. SIO1E4]